MGNTSYVKDLTKSVLIGHKIVAAEINQTNDIVRLITETDVFWLSWVGECCSSCFLANISGADSLHGATILEVEDAKWKTVDDENCEVVETMGTKIKTDKGYVSLETRLEHNGYYSGEILISRTTPLDQYYRPEDSPKTLKTLQDF